MSKNSSNQLARQSTPSGLRLTPRRQPAIAAREVISR
jgi:hypothetical protein